MFKQPGISPFLEHAMFLGLCAFLHTVVSPVNISLLIPPRELRALWWYNSMPTSSATQEPPDGLTWLAYVYIFKTHSGADRVFTECTCRLQVPDRTFCGDGNVQYLFCPIQSPQSRSGHRAFEMQLMQLEGLLELFWIWAVPVTGGSCTG